MVYPYKLNLGYFTDADTQRDSVYVGLTNISTAPLNRVDLAWKLQMPDPATRQLRTLSFPFVNAEGEEDQPLGVGQRRTFVIPPQLFFEAHLLVQATPPEASAVMATIDGQEMLALRGQDFEKLVKGCHPKDGYPEIDLPADRVNYLSNLVGTIIELAQGYKIHPPKEVTDDPGVLTGNEVATKLDGTKWWLRFADGREELLDFRELMVLTYNVFIVRNRMTHHFLSGSPPGNVNVTVRMAVPHIMTKEGVQALLRRLSLESIKG